MCFSPAVSFAASATLGVVGVLTLGKVTQREEWLFASIPLLFATQQGIEGLLWVVLLGHGSPHTQYWLAQSYTVFAGMLWPILVPLSLIVIEPLRRRRWAMGAAATAGVGIALHTLTSLLQFPVTARIAGNCILYEYPVEQTYTMTTFYILATCGAFFCSSHRGIRWLGVVNVIALVIAYRFYHYHLASTWCFFAAVISGLIYLYFDRRSIGQPKPRLAI